MNRRSSYKSIRLTRRGKRVIAGMAAVIALETLAGAIIIAIHIFR